MQQSPNCLNCQKFLYLIFLSKRFFNSEIKMGQELAKSKQEVIGSSFQNSAPQFVRQTGLAFRGDFCKLADFYLSRIEAMSYNIQHVQSFLEDVQLGYEAPSFTDDPLPDASEENESLRSEAQPTQPVVEEIRIVEDRGFEVSEKMEIEVVKKRRRRNQPKKRRTKKKIDCIWVEKKELPSDSSRNFQNNPKKRFVGYIYQRKRIKWIEAKRSQEFKSCKRVVELSTPEDILPRKRFR